MYPMAYRWMSDPTPVTNRAIVIDSGSARNPTSTRRSPTGIHSNRIWTKWRSSSASPSSPKNTTTVATKLAAAIAVASQPAPGSPSRRPNTSSSTKPASGSAGINQTASSTGSTFEQGDVVGRGVGALAEQGDDDGQAHHHLGGGHHQHEHDDRLARRVLQRVRERDEGERDGVEHQLDAHEHHQRVAPDHQPERADREQDRAQHEVPGR